MTEKSEALRLADALVADRWHPRYREHAAACLRRLHALVAACEPYLKEGETPAERIERERGDTEAVCRMYVKQRERNVELLEALRVFVSCSLPVSTEIDDRGHRWTEAYLDQALPIARAAIAKATGEEP
jgi:hypothetical protein